MKIKMNGIEWASSNIRFVSFVGFHGFHGFHGIHTYPAADWQSD